MIEPGVESLLGRFHDHEVEYVNIGAVADLIPVN